MKSAMGAGQSSELARLPYTKRSRGVVDAGRATLRREAKDLLSQLDSGYTDSSFLYNKPGNPLVDENLLRSDHLAERVADG